MFVDRRVFPLQYLFPDAALDKSDPNETKAPQATSGGKSDQDKETDDYVSAAPHYSSCLSTSELTSASLKPARTDFAESHPDSIIKSRPDNARRESRVLFRHLFVSFPEMRFHYSSLIEIEKRRVPNLGPITIKTGRWACTVVLVPLSQANGL